ncbi:MULTISPECIES: adhesion domain-containing protein [unclassified Vibrio]|uniref:adhesion domain-containing protein n=1 Tax=unclassified Vibrio TaxID=2614977 RepID=UPI000C817B60|nr:hypothetical protein [Vibrio sp. 10N.261.54.E10]PMK13691.1 hypothetical protein BCU07_05590 [Vibrio sp. 10N.261.54.E10]
MLDVLPKKANLLQVALILAVSGCNGDSGVGSTSGPDSPDRPDQSNVLYSVQDTMQHTKPRETFYVDLSNNMESSDGTPVALLNVESLNSDYHCDVVSNDQNGFYIKATQVNLCDYRFRVGSSVSRMSTAISYDGYSEATARIAIAENSEQLIPISSATSTGTPISVNVKDELANLGYEVDTSRYTLSMTLTLPNSDSTLSSAVSDPANNVIEYTPGAGLESGVERVLYSYSDGVNVLSGSLDIAVSTTVNGAPIANSTYIQTFTDPDTLKIVSEVPYGKTVTIDVLSLISDPNGDSLQLIDVYAYDADVAIIEDANLDGNLFNDTIFTFTTSNSGYHNITYVVSDNKGGFATGIIKLKSEDLYPIIVFNEGNVYQSVTPPLTMEQAETASIEFEIIGTGDGTNAVDNVTTVAHSKGVAEAICTARGAFLPNQVDLQELYAWKPDGQIFTDYRYPNDKPYWTSDQVDETTTTLVNLFDGSVTASNNEEVNYVLCTNTEYIPEITPVSISLNGVTSIQRDLDVDKHELYQATITNSIGQMEQVPAEYVNWTVTELNVTTFDEHTGILTAYSTANTEPQFNVNIEACYESFCDNLNVTLFAPLGITSYEGSEFLPLFTREQVLRYSDNNTSIFAPNDTDDYSYSVIRSFGYNANDTNFIESGYDSSQTEYYCSSINFDGGGWKEFDSSTIALRFAGAWNADPAYKAITVGRIYSNSDYQDEFWFRGNGFLYKFYINNYAEPTSDNGGITYYRGPEDTPEADQNYFGSQVHVFLSCYR